MDDRRPSKKKPHSKSRSGCFRCKSKRVKCDEARPQCSHCVRYSIPCKYPSARAGPRGSLQQTSNRVKASLSTLPTISTVIPSESNPSTSSLGLIDLRLLHHWISEAALGFGDRPGDSKAWGTTTVELALQHPFLMRSILGLSALHLARLHPDQSDFYHVTAAYHQDMALPAQRYLINNLEHGMNSDNCHAVMAYATLIMAHSLASPRRSIAPAASGSYVVEDITEWLFLVRGSRRILKVAKEELAGGPMGYQLRSVAGMVDTRWNPDDDKLVTLFAAFDGADNCDANVYSKTLQLLRESFAMPFSPGQEIGNKLAISMWVDQLPHRFLDLLRRGKPEALILFAHVAILLKSTKRCWYTEGAGEMTLGTIRDLLGNEWLKWIVWPCEVCGVDLC